MISCQNQFLLIYKKPYHLKMSRKPLIGPGQQHKHSVTSLYEIEISLARKNPRLHPELATDMKIQRLKLSYSHRKKWISGWCRLNSERSHLQK